HNEEIIFSIADSQEAFAINHNLEKDAITLAANSVVIGEENTKLKLMQNYPNPAEKDTRIIFSIPNAGKVKLVVSDLNGKVVKVDEGDFQSGINYFDLNTFKMKSGAYIYRIELEGNVKSRKMIIK
ncbi:MAG: T9SS type A sorting domain-containing protein, partial [Cyclobacteriaceae bacterium]